MPFFRIDGYEITTRTMYVEADNAQSAMDKALTADFINIEDAHGVNAWEKQWSVGDGPKEELGMIRKPQDRECPTCGE